MAYSGLLVQSVWRITSALKGRIPVWYRPRMDRREKSTLNGIKREQVLCGKEMLDRDIHTYIRRFLSAFMARLHLDLLVLCLNPTRHLWYQVVRSNSLRCPSESQDVISHLKSFSFLSVVSIMCLLYKSWAPRMQEEVRCICFVSSRNVQFHHSSVTDAC